MPKLKVRVVKYTYAYGDVVVESDDLDEAIAKVDKLIASGQLQTTAVKWEDPVYEDFSFSTTGDVEDAQEDEVCDG